MASARWVRACSVDELAGREIVAVNAEGLELIIIREGDRLFAAERACPHEGADLLHGRCTRTKLYCPRHLAWFDLESGAVSGGWSFRPLDIYPVRVVGDEIFVDLHRSGDGPP